MVKKNCKRYTLCIEIIIEYNKEYWDYQFSKGYTF